MRKAGSKEGSINQKMKMVFFSLSPSQILLKILKQIKHILDMNYPDVPYLVSEWGH